MAGLSWKYQANASTPIDKPTRKGLAGSSQDKLAARLLLPATNATTGVMQQREAAMADNSPAPVIEPIVFTLIILVPFLQCKLISLKMDFIFLDVL